ncbi:hypothetical protein GCM10008967_18980 [Bacillus carboniphilus]|uniref:YjcZ family sporulation protein n=1 Tax=Bacillus carboniphilus TaxID=86663 RepID=A0ABP3FZI7_9BACI
MWCGYGYNGYNNVGGAYSGNNSFVLIVVLFILLVIVGCICFS